MNDFVVLAAGEHILGKFKDIEQANWILPIMYSEAFSVRADGYGYIYDDVIYISDSGTYA